MLIKNCGFIAVFITSNILDLADRLLPGEKTKLLLLAVHTRLIIWCNNWLTILSNFTSKSLYGRLKDTVKQNRLRQNNDLFKKWFCRFKSKSRILNVLYKSWNWNKIAYFELKLILGYIFIDTKQTWNEKKKHE